MSAYSGTPTVSSSYEYGDRHGKYLGVVRTISIAPSTQGGASNVISVSSLGFSQIDEISFVSFVDGSTQKRALIVWTDGTNVYTGDPQTSTDNARGEPTDVTGTLVLCIKGLPS